MLRREAAQGCGAERLVCGHGGWGGRSSEAGRGRTDVDPDPRKRPILAGRRRARGAFEAQKGECDRDCGIIVTRESGRK